MVVVCLIENVDPMGVHTGDSATVAPAMTLDFNREYQRMRDLGTRSREVGVGLAAATSSSRSTWRDGRLIVIEMNPRGCRSSALASKATGFPIAKIAANRSSVTPRRDRQRHHGGRRLVSNPPLDYGMVVKAPRFAFEKFPCRSHPDHHHEICR